MFVLRPWRYLRSDRNTFCDCDVRRTGVFALLVQYLYPATVHLANAPTHFKDIIRVYDFAFLFLEAPIIKLVQVQKFKREHCKLQVTSKNERLESLGTQAFPTPQIGFKVSSIIA